MGYGLFAIGVNGRHRQPLFRNVEVTVLDVSPDRRHLVIAGVASPPPGDRIQNYLAVTDLHGRDARRIVSTEAGVSYPTAYWSPDGKKIAFTVSGTLAGASTACGFSVWVVGTDGRDLRRVSDCGMFALSRVTSIDLGKAQPWAPDSHRLAFVRSSTSGEASARTGALTIANVDGSGNHELSEHGQVRDPSWSPNGVWIAYDVFIPTKRAVEMRLVRVETGTTTVAGRGFQPSWAPDGRHVAFVDSAKDPFFEGDSIEILVLARRVLSRSRLKLGLADLPTWSPDSRTIAVRGCGKSHRCRQPQIYRMRRDGHALRRLTSEHDIASVVFDGIWWSRDGRRILFARQRLGA